MTISANHQHISCSRWHGSQSLRPSPCVQTEAGLVHMEEEELGRTSSEWDLHTQSVSNTLQEKEISRSSLCLDYNGTLTHSVCWTGSSEGRMENTCEVNDLTLSQITFMHAPNSLFHIHKILVDYISECFFCLHACSFWYIASGIQDL